MTNERTEPFLHTFSSSLHCVCFETCHLSTFCITEGFHMYFICYSDCQNLYMYKYGHQKLGNSMLSVHVMEVSAGGRKWESVSVTIMVLLGPIVLNVNLILIPEGKLTGLDPYTVQLKFEPSGRPGSEDSYYLNFKDNICVVCGSDESYMRKNIVPHDYRRYFPLVMKDHHSHDILLMCPECHRLSTFHDDKLRRELADKYNAPLGKAYM